MTLLSFRPQLSVAPRPYQTEALTAWEAHSRCGVVVLPTGAGKTALGCMAIERVSRRTLIVVPTIDLVAQWSEAVRTILGAPREQVMTGFPPEASTPQLSLFPWEPSDILICTYQGAALHTEDLGHFDLLIFDEVHHLPAPVFRSIAQRAPASSRLGLTATPDRFDGAEELLTGLVGPVVYREQAASLSGAYLAPYRLETVEVSLDADERERYQRAWNTYLAYVRRHGMRGPKGFQEMVKRAGRDGGARKALDAHRTAREIALSARAKVGAVESLLGYHAGERILVFCQHVELANHIGGTLALPVVTHETPRQERAEALRRFREGEQPVLIATSILDEGVDVPDAAVGIVVSGTGQARQFIQRLGRLLRPVPGKEARLYEIVTRDTLEEKAARRRKRQSG